MRSKVVRTLTLALVLGSVGIAMGQQTPQPDKEKPLPPVGEKRPQNKQKYQKYQKWPQKKSKLEEMLAEALRNNPDIRVAAANLTLAEAELDRTRLQVTQKVLTLYHAIQSQQATVDYEQKQYERMQTLLKERAIDNQLVEERSVKLRAAKAKLAELEVQMPALLGKTARAEGDAAREATVEAAIRALGEQRLLQNERELLRAVQSAREARKATGPLAERIRKALQTPVKVDYKDVPFTEVLKDLEKKAPGLSFHIRYLPEVLVGGASGRITKEQTKVTLHFDMLLPIAAILQAIEDNVGSLFIVRDYGILVTSRSDALPPGGITVQEFMRQKPAEK